MKRKILNTKDFSGLCARKRMEVKKNVIKAQESLGGVSLSESAQASNVTNELYMKLAAETIRLI